MIYFLEFVSEALEEVEATTQAIMAQPLLWREGNGGFSRVNLNRFPYNFLFRIKLDAIQILVVRHNARKPSFGTFRK